MEGKGVEKLSDVDHEGTWITRGWQRGCSRLRAAMSARAVLLFTAVLLTLAAVQVSEKACERIGSKEACKMRNHSA